MNIMCGVLKQVEGDVYIKGVSMRKDPVGAKRHIGFFASSASGSYGIAEYLEFCAEIRHISGRDVPKAIKEALGRCGISHFAKRVITVEAVI